MISINRSIIDWTLIILLLNLYHLGWRCRLWRSLQLVSETFWIISSSFLPTRIMPCNSWNYCITFFSILAFNIGFDLVILRFQILIWIFIYCFGFFVCNSLWLRLMILLTLPQIFDSSWTLASLKSIHFTILLSGCNKLGIICLVVWSIV